MVQHDQVDRTFAALADPTRRGVLERLRGGSASISELAEPYAISLTGMKKHVQILEDAGLVASGMEGGLQETYERLDAVLARLGAK